MRLDRETAATWMLSLSGAGLLIALLVAILAPTSALADRAMSPRFSANDTGNITFAANTLMVCPASAAGCTAARATGPISSGSGPSLDNNAYLMQYVNAAPGTVSGSPSFNSSSATLSLPATATVLFAGLYWGGDTSAGTGSGITGKAAPNASLRNQIGFRTPTAAGYTALTATQLDASTGQPTRYGAFANVTSTVQAAGAGTYSVANVQTGTGGDRFAGWTLVVAYRDSNQPARNLTVDDGFISIESSSPPTTIPVSGFLTPAAGPVNTTLGFVAYEGDSGLTGDGAALNGTRLSDGASPPNNFFDSGISNLGSNATTRTPDDVNNFAYDSKLISANGILPNNATAASILVTTSGDTYFPAVVTLATELHAPNIVSSKSVTNVTHPSGPDQRGDVLRYTVSYTNTGADPATNFVMRDPIPSGSTYVPKSLRITAGPQAPASPTDALSDDAGEFNSASGEVVFRLGAGGNATTGGMIPPGATDTVTFEVAINAGAAPGQQITNQATATFIGATLGTPFTNTSPRVTNTVAAPELTLVKSHTGSLIGGLPTPFTLVVSNTGTAPTNGSTVTVTDPFPPASFSSIANAGGAGWTCSNAGLALTCTRSDVLANGESYPPILVEATVANPPPATVSNTATVSGGGSPESTGSDGGGASGLADLSLTKTAEPQIVANGATVTYTLNVQNAGPSTAEGVTVSDPLAPASYGDVEVLSSQGSCDPAVSCSLGSVEANSTVTITITATVLARDTTLTNTASVSSPTPDPHSANNNASASVVVPGTADLAIEKTGLANPAEGGPDSYTITVSNNGPNNAEGVVVNDTLPGDFTATHASGGGFTCTVPGGPGGTVVCTRVALATSEGPQVITIEGALATHTAADTIVNAVAVSSNTADPNLANNTATVSQLIAPSADVGITKRALASDDETTLTGPVEPGGSFDYQLVVTNAGPSSAASVSVTDTLASGITLAETVPGCTPGVGSGGTITCTIATLVAGGTHTFNFNVHVAASAADSALTNTASVSSETSDPNLSNNSASATVGIGEVANLSILKTASAQSGTVGTLITYTLAVTNNTVVGEAEAPPPVLGTTGAVITDVLPVGLQFVESSDCTESSGTVTCAVGPIAQGETVPASFVARVTSAAAGTLITNRATVATGAVGGASKLPDFEPNDNADVSSLTVAPRADLSLTKTVSNSNPRTDDEVEYTLTASNAGPNEATGVTIRDLLPAGLDLIDASPGCDSAGGVVTCALGSLANGEDASVTIRARTTSALAGSSVTNTATISAEEEDPNLANNEASATINVAPLVDLELTKVASNPSPTVGGPVSFLLTLLNHGPSPATGVAISDPLPAGLSFVSAAAGQGSCGASGQTVTCQPGTLAAGAATIVTITADVTGAAGATLTNTATASANEQIERPPVTAQASITPVPGPPAATADLAITKTVNHAKATTGQALTYTIVVANHGPAAAASPTVTDAFSAPVTVVSVHPSSGSCSGHGPLTCVLGSIASGASAEITIVARPTVRGELRNAASVASITPDPNGANNVAHASTKVEPGPAGLRLTKTPSQRRVHPGRVFAFTITVHSLGPEAALGVEVCDALGSKMTFVSVDGAAFHHGRPCWHVASLAKGKSKRFVVRVRAPRVSGPRRLTNTATASAEGVHTRTVRATVELVGSQPTRPGGVTG